MVRTLPRERGGRTPAWPLVTKATAAERARWVQLWKRPVAILWEEQGVEHAVARYVRMALRAETGEVARALPLTFHSTIVAHSPSAWPAPPGAGPNAS